MRKRIDSLKENGQSTIEFLLSFIFVIGFIFTFLKMGMIYTNGYLVHYATFMASRAYMVVDTNSNDPIGSDGAAAKRAQDVFKSIPLEKFIPGFDSKLQIHAPDDGGSNFDRNLYVGVWAEYGETFITPGLIGGRKPLQFRSESFLGREPTRAECIDRVCAAILSIGGNCIDHSTMSDNGC